MVAAICDRSDAAIVTCKMCGKNYLITYKREDMVDWLSGQGFIQDIMPYLTPSERELFISGTCGACFDILFPPLDNEE